MDEPIDQRIFWDEKSEYVNLTLEQLKESYVAINVFGSAKDKSEILPSGQTILFWVVGDGYRTFVYRTSGNAQVIKNKTFDFVSVVDAQKSMISEGRILYLPAGDDAAWQDLGPITPGACVEEDPDFEEIRRAHLKVDPVADEEISKFDDDNWSGTGSFFSGAGW
jgi:hypothetical protein